MSADENPYATPEKYGLEPVGEIDWSSGYFEFNYTVVWRRKSDGRFVYAEDAGCSCPSPFEDIGAEDLTLITSVAGFQAHLDERAKDNYDDGDRAMERANLLAKLVRPWAVSGPTEETKR